MLKCALIHLYCYAVLCNSDARVTWEVLVLELPA